MSRWIVFLALFLMSHEAMAEPLCDGCQLFGADQGKGRPLIVALHGDEGSPRKAAPLWKSAVMSHEVVVFAPKCPTSKGCAGSWWRWNGSPQWLLDRVAALTETHALDPNRRYLVGWSGGASYMGMRGARWFETFAAIALVGGGAPGGASCFSKAGGRCAPVYYLMGNRNPLFGLARDTRAYFERCGHAVEWNVQPGANHAKEWVAYQRSRDAIASWLLERSMGCREPVPPARVASSRPAPSPLEQAPTSSPETRPSSTAHCSCSTHPGDGLPIAFVIPIVLLVTRRRRSPCHRAS